MLDSNDLAQISQLVEDSLNRREAYNQYNLSPISNHAHTGVDASQVAGENLSLIDSTINNVNPDRHGFVPKLPNNASLFLDGTGNFTAPGGGGTTVMFDNSLYLGTMAAGPNTTAYICGGSNRVITIVVFNNANNASATSVTYNGAGLTELGFVGLNNARLGYWYLLNPTIGSNNIVVTMPGTDTGSAGVSSYSNSVSQIVRNFQSDANNSGGGSSIVVNSASGSLIVDGFYNTTSSCNAGPGQTAIAIGGTGFRGMSFKNASSPSTTMAWTGAAIGFSYEVAAEIVH